MSFTPQRAVEVALSRLWTPLGYLHGYLDMGMAESFKAYRDVCRPEEIRGGPFAGTLRQTVWGLAANPVMGATSARLVERPNMGMRLVDGELVIRVWKRPFGRRVPNLLPVTEPPAETLFGVDWSTCPFDLAVLWAPDIKNQCLHSAVLAAVERVKNGRPRAIYAEEALPTATAGSVNPAPPVSDLDDDFDDRWLGYDKGKAQGDDEEDPGDGPKVS
ncbi:MAG: hypothetical protein QM650_18470 [Microlunatus sp.]